MNDKCIARSEVERRVVYFEKLKTIAENSHALVIDCIDNNSHRKPHSGQVMNRLKEIKVSEAS